MLTSKQEKFVQELVKGKSQREAYKIAYPGSEKWKDNSIDNKACLLYRNAKVKQRYDELTKGAIAKSQDTAESMRAFIIETLKKIAAGEICDETSELDAEGHVLRQRKSRRAADVTNALNKLAEYYGVAPVAVTNNDITIKIESADEYAD